MSDEEISALWLEAFRRTNQTLCAYPQIDTLREFARAMWRQGFTAGQVDVPGGSLIPCPF